MERDYSRIKQGAVRRLQEILSLKNKKKGKVDEEGEKLRTVPNRSDIRRVGNRASKPVSERAPTKTGQTSLWKQMAAEATALQHLRAASTSAYLDTLGVPTNTIAQIAEARPSVFDLALSIVRGHRTTKMGPTTIKKVKEDLDRRGVTNLVRHWAERQDRIGQYRATFADNRGRRGNRAN